MLNFEAKAYLRDPQEAARHVEKRGLVLKGDNLEIDTYFDTPEHRLKYREDPSVRPPRLIAYERSDAAEIRQSHFQVAELESDDPLLLDTLKAGLGVRVVVEKHRRTYVGGDLVVNIDTLEGRYNFIEVEAMVSPGSGPTDAESQVKSLLYDLGIVEADLLALSYERLAPSLAGAVRWLQQLGSSVDGLLLIDGPSGAGKSSLIETALQRQPGLAYIKRTASRPRRSTDSPDEYEFVTVQDFESGERLGEFLEFKEFLFDMRYGLRWENVASALRKDPVALGIMNLGNVRHVKTVVPQATTILVEAPPGDLIRRLRDRGTHSEEAIEERIHNAGLATLHRDMYDFVIKNREGEFERAAQELLGILQLKCDQVR